LCNLEQGLKWGDTWDRLEEKREEKLLLIREGEIIWDTCNRCFLSMCLTLERV
jgi:hypothetical protein